MTIQPDNSSNTGNEDVAALKKERWNAPVIVPLDINLTEHNPGVGLDGDIWADSTHS
jgi:hypothetical protein